MTWGNTLSTIDHSNLKYYSQFYPTSAVTPKYASTMMPSTMR